MDLPKDLELDWLKKWSHYAGQTVAIKDGETGREFNYRSCFELACRGAEVLEKKFNIAHGDRVAVLATNELEYVFLFFALQRLGAIMVPVNFRLTQREVDHIVSDCSPKLVVYQETYQTIIDHLPKINSGITQQNYLLSDFSKDIGSQKFEPNQNHLLNVKTFAATPMDAAMIIYTSGTTGAPKGAIISHSMIFWNSVNTSLRLNISQSDCAVIFLPFFHTGGWNVLTTPFFHRGAKVVILKKFDAEQILKLSQDEKATLLFGVPTTMDMMARVPLFKNVNLSSIRYAIVGGEPMPVTLIQTWHEKGISIRQGYGLTEFGPNVFSLNQEDAIRKIGSIGFANFYTETKIVDNDGKEVPTNEVGELILKGPMCMTGYWKNEKATKETLKNGWLYTGDLVRQDQEGYVYVVGRKKDMYKSGGENVYPPELEQVLVKMPGVREVAVVGVPDTKWGEVGKAFLVKDDPNLNEQMLSDYCSQNLAKFKIPKYFVFVKDLPKGDSGKILKRKLLEMYPN